MTKLKFIRDAVIASVSLGLSVACLDISVRMSEVSNFPLAVLAVLGFFIFASYAVIYFIINCV